MGTKTSSLKNDQPSTNTPDDVAKPHHSEPGTLGGQGGSEGEIHDPIVGNAPSNHEQQIAEGPFLKVTAIFTVILGLAAIVTNLQTCSALRDNRDAVAESERLARDQFQAAQRPWVDVGTPEGKVAEYRPSHHADKKGILIAYFYNAGNSTASHFLVNAWTPISPAPSSDHQVHIERYWAHLKGGKVRGFLTAGGEFIAPHIVRPVVISAQWTPTDRQFADFKRSAQLPVGGFHIEGTFEFCDVFGFYRCEAFRIEYRPEPLNDFISGSPFYPCFIPPVGAEVAAHSSNEIVEMPVPPRCEQPGEQTLSQAEQKPTTGFTPAPRFAPVP